MPVSSMYFCFIGWILISTSGVFCYNVDTKFAITYQGDTAKNYFGFSVGLLRNSHGYSALITAPRANSSFPNLRQIHQTGALFTCNIPASGNITQCEEVEVEREGNVHHANKYDDYMSYTNKLDDMWLGVSLDIQHVPEDQDRNNVVVCGHLWKNNIPTSGYYINGACYVLDGNLNIATENKIVPFAETEQNRGSRRFYYESSQTGASVAFSEDGLDLLLGSPGYRRWRGAFVSYELDQSGKIEELEDPIIPDIQDRLTSAAYMGYSITSGNFFGDGITYRAVGAPRDNNYCGKVYIFSPVNNNRPQVYSFSQKQGRQTGEYFGASISGIDLNADGLTDLLVGAPFYSKDSGGDEGKVYVYIGARKTKDFLPRYHLYGGNKPDARFGTCIGNTGDLNQDGFNDVAIGAPYEDEKGAVYIYHGTRNGINTEYAQRIGAEDISTLFSGFGISISRGLDIDDNSYPDILIGSYASSNAVLLRTYPVINLSSTLRFNLTKINMNHTTCEIGGLGEKLPCVGIKYCMSYSGKHVEPSLEFQTELRIDTVKQKIGKAPRGFFLSGRGTHPLASISRKIKIQTGSNCFQETAFIYKNISDEIKPIEFLLSYNLDRDAMTSCQSTDFPKHCPVIDPSSRNDITESIGFQIDCENICEADLSVEAYIVGNPSKRTLIAGQNETLTLDVKVKNKGEPAYVTELFITLPPETPLVKYDLCELGRNQQEEYVNTTLRCSFRNALKNGEAANIQIIIDVRSIPADTSSLAIYFRATTESEDINKDNNDLVLPIKFETAADFNITGNPENPRIPQTEETQRSGKVSITHNYYVKYYGPSPVDKINIKIYVPSVIESENGSLTFLNLNDSDFTRESDEISTECNFPFQQMGFKSSSIVSPGENPYDGGSKIPEVHGINSSHHITKRSTDEKTTDSRAQRGKDYVLDCDIAKCDVISCDASPFRNGQKSIKFVLTVQVDLDVLGSVMDEWNSIEFITKGEISAPGAKMLSRNFRNETTVETAIIRLRPPGAQKVQNWIIFVSIGAGLLLLLIIFVVLIKIGFFKRKRRDRMKSMMHQVQMKEMEAMAAPGSKETADDKALCADTRKEK